MRGVYYNDDDRTGTGIYIELNGDKEPLDRNNGIYEGGWMCNEKRG